eukprot:6259013-Amphidinium_carterae.1
MVPLTRHQSVVLRSHKVIAARGRGQLRGGAGLSEVEVSKQQVKIIANPFKLSPHYFKNQEHVFCISCVSFRPLGQVARVAIAFIPRDFFAQFEPLLHSFGFWGSRCAVSGALEQQVRVVFDTGSADLWLRKSKLEKAVSSTLQCPHPACDEEVEIKYVDGSHYGGPIMQDSLTLAD